ncbi:MAG: alpha/beta hydrolase [Bacteroidales bacterium]
MMKYLHYQGKKIYYREQGSGPAVVLVHGYLEDSSVWNGFADDLASFNRVFAIDLPGHGGSDVYGDTHTMEFMAGAINAILESSGISRAIITGHSMGGYVVLAFADLYPSKTAGFCLIHSHPFADIPEIIKKRQIEISLVRTGKRYLFYPGNVKKMFADANLEKFGNEVERIDKIASAIRSEGIIAVLNGMMIRPQRLRLMEGGNIPYLWILGARDNYINCDSMKQRVTLPSNADLVILEDSGHMGFIEERSKTLEALSTFIKRAAV